MFVSFHILKRPDRKKLNYVQEYIGGQGTEGRRVVVLMMMMMITMTMMQSELNYINDDNENYLFGDFESHQASDQFS